MFYEGCGCEVTSCQYHLQKMNSSHLFIHLQRLSAGCADYRILKQVDKLIDDKVFRLISLSRQEHRHFQDLIGHLGKGEASCIAYAKERKAIVVTDDRTARKQCSLMKIPVTGTVGILKASVLDGQIPLDRADDILQKMISAGFYSPIRNIADIV